MKKRVLLIIPAFNEQDNILKVCKSIIEDGRYDYIVINDGSKDNTEKICKDNKLNYITLVYNLGIGGAVQTGYKYAYENNYDIAVQLDGDGQHSVECVEDIQKKYEYYLNSTEIDDILNSGVARTREIAKEKYDLVKKRINIGR